MDILSNYDHNKRFISPEQFLFLLKDIKNIYDFKIIKTQFYYLINDKCIENCYLSTIIYQYILSQKNDKTYIYDNLFYLDTKDNQVYINYVTKNNQIYLTGQNNINLNNINLNNIDVNNENEYYFIKQYYNITSFPISIIHNNMY
jgi:hypothetical protein